jgi:hypothetical protein
VWVLVSRARGWRFRRVVFAIFLESLKSREIVHSSRPEADLVAEADGDRSKTREFACQLAEP